MYRCVFPQFDSTIYERHPNRNTGIDQILELRKLAIGTKDPIGNLWANTYNSRILVKFDLNEISKSISYGKIPASAKFRLRLFATEATSTPISYNIYCYPVSESWVNGRGNYNDIPEIRDGVSWVYRDRYKGKLWNSGSNVDFDYQTNSGGGSWYTGSAYEVSQTFEYDAPDLNFDVTKIVKHWLSGSIVNNGFLLKRSNTDESGSSDFGSVKYFSRDTHTIYIPRLECTWDDSVFSGTGSFNQIDSENFVLYSKNLRRDYRAGEEVKMRFACRPTFPVQQYLTSSLYLTERRLPTSSYYSVVDYHVRENLKIIDFDTTSSKVSCDAQGNFVKLRMDSFLPERYYKIIFRVERQGGNDVQIIDNGFYFKVVK